MDNQSILLAERPRDAVLTANCFQLCSAEVPQIGEGKVLLQTMGLTMESILYARARRVTKIQRDPIPPAHPMQRCAAGCGKAFDEQVKAWIDAGQVKPMEDIVTDLAQAPDAFQGVFEGANRGIRLVQVAD